MGFDYILEENEQSEELFNLEEIIEFQTRHKVEVMMQEDYQFHCFIDYKEGDGSYAQSFTFLHALITGIKKYKKDGNV